MFAFSSIRAATVVFAFSGLSCSAYAQVSPFGDSTQFVSYSFPSGLRMEYDQRYKVGITMRNNGGYEFDTSKFSIVQDETDINWRPNFSTPMFSKTMVQPNETFDINFYVTPKVSGWCHLGDCNYTFRWQLIIWRAPMTTWVRFGQVTPVAGLRVSRSVQPPTTPPSPSYMGMIYTPPPGTIAPVFTPERADEFPDWEAGSPANTPPPPTSPPPGDEPPTMEM